MLLSTSSPPEVRCLTAFMETRRIAANPLAVFMEHGARLGETYYYRFGGVKKVLVSHNPSLLRHVLKDNYENYRKSELQTKRMHRFLGDGLLTTHGQTWLQQRRLIQKGFRADRLEAMTSIMHASLEEPLAKFDAAIVDGPIDIYDHLKRMTFKMVAHSLFSTHLADSDIQFISDAICEIQGFIVRQIVAPFLAPWFLLSGELGRHERMRRRGDAILAAHIRERQRHAVRDDDLLQLLLDARYAGSGEGMSNELILSECMQILVAGHATTSTALAWTLYLLSRHPHHLHCIRAEMAAVLGGRQLAASFVPHLPVSNRVIEEALRLYPPFWMIDRVAMKDDEADGVLIPAGMTLVLFIYGAHHSPAYWADPEEFKPERFDNDQKPGGFLHLPFGAGPRRCIGASYAKLQMLVILSVLLQDYEFVLADDRPISPSATITMRPTNGISMRFRRSGHV